MRAARRCAENFPKPVKFTWPPPESSRCTVSRNASTALPASLLDRPDCAATRSTNSCLVTRQPSYRIRDGPQRNRRIGLAQPCAFCWPCDIVRREQRPHSHRETRESVDSALLPVDHADRISALQPGLAQRLDGLRCCASGCDDVLDQADAIALFERAFEAIVGAVALAGLADDQERQAGAERRGGCERDGAQFGAGEAHGVRLDLGHLRGEALRQRAEQLGPRLEAVLVEVVLRPAAGAEHEVALEIGVLADRPQELAVVHVAARSALHAARRARAAAAARPRPSPARTRRANRPRSTGRPARASPGSGAGRSRCRRTRSRRGSGSRGAYAALSLASFFFAFGLGFPSPVPGVAAARRQLLRS